MGSLHSAKSKLSFEYSQFLPARKGEIKIPNTSASTILYLHHKPISWATLCYNVNIQKNWAEAGSYNRSGCSE